MNFPGLMSYVSVAQFAGGKRTREAGEGGERKKGKKDKVGLPINPPGKTDKPPSSG